MIKIRDFIPQGYSALKEIIIYGASKYGEIAYYLLKYYGIIPSMYCDRAIAGQTYKGIPIIAPDKLVSYSGGVIVLVASADYFNEICDTLEGYGFQDVYTLSYMLTEAPLDENVLSYRARDIYKNKQNYIDVATHRGQNIYFTRVQYVVSERCSLKCRDCTHLMQYYKNPENIDLSYYRDAFEKLLSVTDYISELRILGGEPFMNKEMYRIIEWWHDSPKIGVFTVYTNGTIIPDETCLYMLKRERVRVRISNYKINTEQIKKLSDTFERYGINYYVTEYDAWQDAGDLRCRNYSSEEKSEIFSNCFERNCVTFYRGQLHRCPRSAHAMHLKAMPDVQQDYVDFGQKEESEDFFICRVKNLLNRTWIEACNYCDGPNNHMQHITPAVQICKPLVYEEIKI